MNMKTHVLSALFLVSIATAAPAPHINNLCGQVSRGDMPAVQHMLSMGANPNIHDAYGKLLSPLQQ